MAPKTPSPASSPAGMLAVLALTVSITAPPASAQVPENCPYTCHQKYALCIAASCDAETGECGRCDAGDGSCGYCYVFEGPSCSFQKPCAEIRPNGDTVYSTYSEVLATDFGFEVMTCPEPSHTADCMDGECKLTGRTVTLVDRQGDKHELPTAVCQCRIETPGGGGTLGGRCSSQNCSAVWSTAGTVLDSQPHCSAG